MIKQRVLLYILGGIGVIVGLVFYQHLMFFEPQYKIAFDYKKLNKPVWLNARLGKSKCYEVGFIGDEIFTSKFQIGGTYSLKLYHDGKVYQEYNLSKAEYAIQNNHNDKTKLLFLNIEKKYSNIQAELTLTSEETALKGYKENIYFFINPSLPLMLCGKSYEETMENYRLRKLTIDVPETNSTLQPLYNAIVSNDLKTVKYLIPSKFDVNVKMIAGRTALHFAAYYDRKEIAEYLIAQGADVNVEDKRTEIVINTTSGIDHPSKAVRKGLDPTIGKTPLHYAIENNSTRTLQLLLDHGSDLSKVQEVENHLKIGSKAMADTPPPLYYSAASGLFDVTKILLEHGAEEKPSWRRYAVDEYVRQICSGEFQRKESYEVCIKKRQLIFDLLKQYGIENKPQPLTYESVRKNAVGPEN